MESILDKKRVDSPLGSLAKVHTTLARLVQAAASDEDVLGAFPHFQVHGRFLANDRGACVKPNTLNCLDQSIQRTPR